MKKIILLLLLMGLLNGCSNNQAVEKQINLSDYETSFSENYLDTFMVEVNDADLYSMFEMLTPDLVKQYVYTKAFLDIKCDEVFMIQLTDESYVEKIKAVLETRKNEIIEEFSGYIDSEAAIAQNGIIYSSGSYVFMLIGSNAQDMQDEIIKALEA